LRLGLKNAQWGMSRFFLALPKTALQWILLTAGLRLLLATQLGLGTDESYMVAVARQLSWGYFDHPPLSFWLVHATVWLTGSEAAWVVRLPFILLFAGSSWLLYRLTARLFDAKAALHSLIFFNLMPVFTLSTGGWVLPDGLMVFALLAAINTLLPALLPNSTNADGGKTDWRWLAAGGWLGLALLSKYLAVFLPLGIGLYLITCPSARQQLRRLAPWGGLLLAALIFLPVVWWNSQHDWASLAFQAGRGVPNAGEVHLRFDRMLAAFGGQALYLLPWLWLALLGSALAAILRRWHQPPTRLLLMLTLPAMLIFPLLALWAGGRILPHWAVPGYLMGLPLLGDATSRWLQKSPVKRGRRLKFVQWGSGLLLLGFCTLLVTELRYGWIQRNIFVDEVYFQNAVTLNPVLELLNWQELPAAVAQFSPKPPAFLASDRWMHTAKVDYIMAGKVPVLCLNRDQRHFAWLQDAGLFAGQDGVVVLQQYREQNQKPQEIAAAVLGHQLYAPALSPNPKRPKPRQPVG
jgi:4-amino-4-deoxy-L-arabinose transferase-like glycosyltransferase